MIYDYRCGDCKAETMVERSIHEVSTAPVCNLCGESMSRVFAVGGITFKGTGFYKTS